MSDDWQITYEKVEPHGLCCRECANARAQLEQAHAALQKIATIYPQGTHAADIARAALAGNQT